MTAPSVPLVVAPCGFAGDCGQPSVALVTNGVLRHIDPLFARARCLEHVELACRALSWPPSAPYLNGQAGDQADVLRVEWYVARAS